MIRLSEHRKHNLEMMFQHATDRDMIHELVRRGRFHQMQASALFWPEMRDEPGYMDSINRVVMHHLATALMDGDIKPAVLSEREFQHAVLDEDFKLPGTRPGGLGPNFEKQTVLTADVIVLCSREPKLERSCA